MGMFANIKLKQALLYMRWCHGNNLSTSVPPSPSPSSKTMHRPFSPSPSIQPTLPFLWLHGHSLGELNACYNLLHHLLTTPTLIPSLPATFLFTSNTPHALETLSHRLPSLPLSQPSFHTALLPPDTPSQVRHFLSFLPETNILATIFVELDYRPILFAHLKQKSIPVALFDAQISQLFSFCGCFGIRPRTKKALSELDIITSPDAYSFDKNLHIEAEQRTSLKFLFPRRQEPRSSHDESLALIRHAINGRPVWLAASTHLADEKVVLSAHGRLRRRPGLENALLIVVPRMPGRGNAVERMARRLGLQVGRRGAGCQIPARGIAVYVADTLGELAVFYAVVGVALIGNSFGWRGKGHNFAEAARFGVVVVHGKKFGAFQELVDSVLREIERDGEVLQGRGEWKKACMEAENVPKVEALVAAALMDKERTSVLGVALKRAAGSLNERAEKDIVEVMSNLLREADVETGAKEG